MSERKHLKIWKTLGLQIPSKKVFNPLKTPQSTFLEGVWSPREKTYDTWIHSPPRTNKRTIRYILLHFSWDFYRATFGNYVRFLGFFIVFFIVSLVFLNICFPFVGFLQHFSFFFQTDCFLLFLVVLPICPLCLECHGAKNIAIQCDSWINGCRGVLYKLILVSTFEPRCFHGSRWKIKKKLKLCDASLKLRPMTLWFGKPVSNTPGTQLFCQQIQIGWFPRLLKRCVSRLKTHGAITIQKSRWNPEGLKATPSIHE